MIPQPSEELVDAIRAASRRLVRELGFMGGEFAGTDLPPSAVHALIELEPGGVTARDLAVTLHLEKSSISRLLRKLIGSGYVEETRSERDSRTKVLSLTAAGHRKVSAIHEFARRQVTTAITRLDPWQQETVRDGLRLYAKAFGRGADSVPTDTVYLQQGYHPGLIARITEMHALYYSRLSGFGQPFESMVASGLAEFCGRLDDPNNQIWTAHREKRLLGSIAIDGEDLGPGIAHLRWFIVDDELRGTDTGKRLLDAALAFVDARGMAETHLWTFSGLAAARHLYETQGFALAEQRPGTQWGTEVLEQRFVRQRR